MKTVCEKPLKTPFYAVIAAVLLASASCTNTKPEISYGFLQLVIYETERGPREHFSFFIVPNDDDGLENLSHLYLYHDREQYRWEIKSSEWISYTQEGITWIGTRSVSIPEGSLPRGVYKAVLVNKGGERTERNFTFDGEVLYPFPEFYVEDGVYTVNSQWPVNKLVCYDGSGNYSATVGLQVLSGDVSLLHLPANVRTAALWAEDLQNFCSAFTNAVSFD